MIKISKKHETPDLTQGNITASVILFSLPLIISSILQILYHSVDTFFVGHFMGTNHLAGVSVGGPVIQLTVMVLGGLSSGVSVVIAHYKGARQQKALAQSVTTAVALYLLLAVAVTFVGLLTLPLILQVAQTPAEAWREAYIYLFVVLCGTPFLFGYNLVGAIQRGLGNSRSSMDYVLISSLMNILLDTVFVAILRWGAFGAALGTVIAQACAFGLGIRQLSAAGEGGMPLLSGIRFYKKPLKQILRIGLPTALNEVMVAAAMFTVNSTANSFGLVEAAAYGVGRTIDGIAIVADGAMNSAMASFGSRNVGANKTDRAKKGLRAALLFSGTIGLVMFPIVWGLCPYFVGYFDSNPAVMASAISYLRHSAFSYVFFSLVGPLIGFIRGTGNQKASVIIGLIAQFGFRIPTTLLAAHFLGFYGVAYGILIGPVSSVCMYGIYILTGAWKKGLNNLNT